MAAHKRRAAPPTMQQRAKEREVADRVARARAQRRDPTGVHHEAIAELARDTGRDVVELLDLWDERAATREYDGCTDRAAAELAAVEDVRDIVITQRGLEL